MVNISGGLNLLKFGFGKARHVWHFRRKFSKDLADVRARASVRSDGTTVPDVCCSDANSARTDAHAHITTTTAVMVTWKSVSFHFYMANATATMDSNSQRMYCGPWIGTMLRMLAPHGICLDQ